MCFLRRKRRLVKIRVLFHDRCFDGACSAALFTRLHRERVAKDAEYEYRGMLHRAGALYQEGDFAADGENAIVDFKYSPSPLVNWWFDHHESAFVNEDDRSHYEQLASSRMFYDAQKKSCTKLIAEVGERVFGMDLTPAAEMIKWADIIDGAQYESAEFAVGLSEPAMKLTMALEATTEAGYAAKVVKLLAEKTLDETLAEPLVASRVAPLLERHAKNIVVLREKSSCEDKTIFFDVSDHDMEGYNKFIPYYLHPESVYSVGLSRSTFRVKVSVGSNPWAKAENMTNLAKICERYGGGGHAKVGAISFPPNAWDEAKKASEEILAELRAHAREHHA